MASSPRASAQALPPVKGEKKGPESQVIDHGPRIHLIPKPSTNINDPLNWSKYRKIAIFVALVYLCFASVMTSVCNLLAFTLQAKTYNKPVKYMTYAASANLGGSMVGPVLLLPLSRVIGRPAVLFWSCILNLVTQIWAALSDGPGDYVSFVASRLLSGMFASFPGAITPAYIMELFFLHQRGRLFTALEVTFLFGSLSPVTIGGFIVKDLDWPWTFWWTVPFMGLAAVLCFVFLEETNFDREKVNYVRATQDDWFRNRFETFFLGWKTVPRVKGRELRFTFAHPLILAVAPICVVPGLFTCISYGFKIIAVLQSTIYLQTPVSRGGYGFTPIENAYFSFTPWISILACFIIGHTLGDRFPLWLAKKRSNGVWRPEYRLCNIIWPAILLPIGHGIFGAALQYHYSVGVLAFGYFLICFGAMFSVPICLNYACECFVSRGVEVGIAFNIWRSALAVSLNFYVDPWDKAVGPGWMFGMVAFFCLIAGLGTCLIGLTGQKIRTGRLMTGVWRAESEEGEKIEDVESVGVESVGGKS